MLRWKLYNYNNTLLGEFETLKDAFFAGNIYNLKTHQQYFIEDVKREEELLWTDIA